MTSFCDSKGGGGGVNITMQDKTCILQKFSFSKKKMEKKKVNPTAVLHHHPSGVPPKLNDVGTVCWWKT